MADYDGVHVGKYKVRGVGYVRLWWYVGEGSKRHSSSLGPAKDWTKAKINRARLDKEKELAMQPGRVASGKAPTLKAWWEQWKQEADVTASTIALMQATIDKLVAFGIPLDRRIDKISRSEAASWRAWLADQGVSEATVCKHVRCASSLFGERNGAASLDLIPYNPFSRLKKNVKTATKGYPDLTEANVSALLDACPSPAWRAMVGLTLHAGVRRGEAMAMRWTDVLWDKGRLRVPNIKTSGGTTSRDCRMEPELERLLLSCFESAEGDRVVALPESNLNRGMLRIIKRAGMDAWREPFHALRRRRASLWKLAYPAYVVDAWMGHSAAVSREHYLSVPEDLYESAQHRRNISESEAKSGVSE